MTERWAECWECNLPDPYAGAGDGIGSCRCPREDCGCSPTDAQIGACPHDDDSGYYGVEDQ